MDGMLSQEEIEKLLGGIMDETSKENKQLDELFNTPIIVNGRKPMYNYAYNPQFIDMKKEILTTDKSEIDETMIRQGFVANSKARKYGLLELEEFINMTENDVNEWLKDFLYLVIDGTDPDYIIDYASNLYYYKLKGKKDTINFFLALYISLLIQEGINPLIMEWQLTPFLDKDNLKEIVKSADNDIEKQINKEMIDINTVINEKLDHYKHRNLYNTNDVINIKFRKLDDNDLKKVIQNTEDDIDLFDLMLILDKETVKRILLIMGYTDLKRNISVFKSRDPELNRLEQVIRIVNYTIDTQTDKFSNK